jgi:hypothetical protein
MKASELRIGNLVEYKNQYINVSGIGPFGIQSEGKEYLIIAKFSTPDIQPIPLTEEWLLKFGFKWKGLISKGRYLTIFTPCGKALFFKDNYFIFSGVTIETQIKYVHQMQNLYFALTGEELTLKP